MSWLLAPYAERRTYRILLYLVLGVPLGVFEFVLLVTGFSLGLGLLITLLGVPILIGTLLVAGSRGRCSTRRFRGSRGERTRPPASSGSGSIR